MEPTRSALIAAAGVIAAALIAWLGSHWIPRAQKDNLITETAERVVGLQEIERKKLAARITELESEVQTLKIKYSDGERALEHARGENTKLAAQVGTLQAALAAKEVELATARAQLVALAPPAAA